MSTKNTTKHKVEFNLTTPITYYGGKQNMVRHILPLIPDHHVYTEAFFGGGAVFFAKPKSELETINDLNGELVNFYQVTQRKFKELKALISETLNSHKSHRQAWVVYNNPELFSDVKRAWAVWVLSAQGFGGQLSSSWGYDGGNGAKNSVARKVKNKKFKFTSDYAERLESCSIECRDALKVITSRDGINSFHYVDPPYFNSDMGHYGGYTEENYDELLKTLSGIKGRFLLSSYPSKILDKYVKENGWYQVEVKAIVSAAKGVRKPKVEVLTANYNIVEIYRKKYPKQG